MMYEGDIVEIGLGYAHTTLKLLKLAKKHGRKVIGIDPFEEGWHNAPKSYGIGYPYEKFQDSIEGYEKHLDLQRVNSLSLEAEQYLKDRPIAFAYIDGLQFKGAVLNDLRICSQAKVIMVDDANRLNDISQVMPAVEEYCVKNNKLLILEDRWAIIK